MNSTPTHHSLFINSLLSNKEILIKESNDIQITECSFYKHAKTIIPLDLVSTNVKEGYKPDFQWLLFSLVNIVAVIVFVTLAISQSMTFPFVLAGIFALGSVLSVFAAYKYKNTIYTFQYDDSDTKLFSLSSSDLNSAQVNEFTKILVSRIQDNLLINEECDYNDNQLKVTGSQNCPLESYSEHLSFLYDEGIIDDVLLDRLQKIIHNKLYGSKHETDIKQVSSNVIPFRSNRIEPLPQTAE